MTKLTILFTLLLPLSSIIRAQVLCEWGDEIQFGETYFNDVAVDDFGNTYVSGYFGDQIQVGSNTVYAQGSLDGHIMKYSQNGQRLWVTSFSSTQPVLTRGMDVDPAGNVTIHGSYSGNLTVQGVNLVTPISSEGRGFIAQLDPTGSLNWIKEVISGSNGYSAKCLEVDNAGNVLFENYNSTTVDGVSSNGPYTLTKLDQDGNLQWRYETSINTSGVVNNNLIAQFNDGYAIAGRISDTINIAGTMVYPIVDTIIDQFNDTTISLRPEILVIFLDENGNETDFRRIQGSYYNNLQAMYATNSVLYIAGKMNGYITNGAQSIFEPSSKNFLTAFDDSLTPLFLETSTSYECRGLYANQSHIYTVGLGGYLEKFNLQGIYEDKLNLSTPSGVNYIQDIRGYTDGKVVISGVSSGPLYVCGVSLEPVSGFGAYILKLDGEIVSLEDLNTMDPDIAVFPNPTTSNLTIQGEFESGTLELFSLDGKKVAKSNFEHTSTIEMDCSQFKPGVYILNIKAGISTTHCQKIIIE